MIDKMIDEILDERILNDGNDAKGWKKYNDGIKKSVQVIREYQTKDESMTLERKKLTSSKETNEINEYLVNGGKHFTISSIDTIRDGGTKIIKTTKDDYYINNDSWKFHSGYRPSEENLITDPLLIEYLINQIEKYIKKCEQDIERNKNLLIEIKK